MYSNLYLAHNPRREYHVGDKIIRYSSCADKIFLLQCIETTQGDFNKNKWIKIGEEATEINICRGQRADYLGSCAKNIVIRSYTPDTLRGLGMTLRNTEEDIYFDNITYI